MLRKLGEGGMGVVYVGLDERLGREVAIKLLRTQKGDTDQARLLREAQVMARLSHPNVVRVYEIGDEEATSYIVMELIDGITLRQWLRRAARSQAKILAIFDAAGRGLAAAHAKGLVHRDFKPDNVMIAEDGRVLVMDFGLARGNAAAADEKVNFAERGEAAHGLITSLTVTGHILGTPAYMAPEQLVGRRADARTDQFAFCIALWEALYGKRPFPEDNFLVRAQAVMEGFLIVPQGSRVPRCLRRALERGLSVEPEQRWPSMTELLEAIRIRPRRLRSVMLTVGIISSVSLIVMLAREHGSDAELVVVESSTGNDAMSAEWSESQANTSTDVRASVRAGTTVDGSTSVVSTSGESIAGAGDGLVPPTGPKEDPAAGAPFADESTRKDPPRPPTTCKFTLPTAMGSKLSNRGPERPLCTRLRSQVTVLGSTDRDVRLRVRDAALVLQPGRPRTTRIPRACWLVSGSLEASYLALSVDLDSTKCSD